MVMVSIKKLLILTFLLSLYACGTTGNAPLGLNISADDNAAVQEKQLLSTIDYLPVQKVNNKGELIDYKPSKNPYLKRGLAIKKVHLALFLAAKRAYDKDNLDEAGVLLQDLVSQTNKLSGPWVKLSDIALEKNQYQIAEERLIKAIDINKNNVNAYLRLAKIQRLQGEYVNAHHVYVKALSIWKDFPEAHLNLGVLYDVYLNEPVQARDHMKAYQFLTEGKNKKVDLWIEEIEKRAGITPEETASDIAKLNQKTPLLGE